MKQHPKSILNKRRASKVCHNDADELVECGIEYLQEQVVLQPRCKNKLGGGVGTKKCSCLSVFVKKDEALDESLTHAVARYMVCFSKKKQHEQWAIVADWIRHADPKYPFGFGLPFIHDGNNHADPPPEMSRKICSSALLTILGHSRHFWKTCKESAANGTIRHHGLAGRESNNTLSDELVADLHLFLSNLMVLQEPLATGNTDEDVNYLPPSYSKRGLYKGFCHNRGWKTTTTTKGNVKREERTDENWTNQQIQPIEICGWSSFRSFWKKHYPELRVRTPSVEQDVIVATGSPVLTARTPALERMQELESIKQFLTASEYASKRQAILDSI